MRSAGERPPPPGLCPSPAYAGSTPSALRRSRTAGRHGRSSSGDMAPKSVSAAEDTCTPACTAGLAAQMLGGNPLIFPFPFLSASRSSPTFLLFHPLAFKPPPPRAFLHRLPSRRAKSIRNHSSFHATRSTEGDGEGILAAVRRREKRSHRPESKASGATATRVPMPPSIPPAGASTTAQLVAHQSGGPLLPPPASRAQPAPTTMNPAGRGEESPRTAPCLPTCNPAC